MTKVAVVELVVIEVLTVVNHLEEVVLQKLL